MTNSEIGHRIRIAREKRGLNKKELAQKIQVADSTIKRYEDGDIKKIKMPVIESIANTLHVNPMWIIGKDVPMEIETFEQKWDREVKDFFDKTNAFEMQLKCLGWSYEHYGCYWWYEYNELGLRPNDEGQLTEDGTGTLVGCNGKKCENCNEREQYYLFSNGKISFKVSIDDYDSFKNDGETFFKERLQQLLKKSMQQMFTESEKPMLNAAHERTDIEVSDEMRKHDDDIMNDDSEWE